MKVSLLINGARRFARAGVRSAPWSLQYSTVGMISKASVTAQLAASMQLPVVSSMRSFSTTRKPKVGTTDDEGSSDDDSESDDDDEDEDSDDEDEEDVRASNDANHWDEERWGALDSEDWQGFTGDLDAVTEEGVPTWLQSVRDLSAIHEENRMRAKLARRAMEEAKKNVIRVRKVDEFGRAYGTGRRKTSTARVWIKRSDKPFEGRISINKQDLVDYFVRDTHREDILKPFSVVNEIGNFDVYCTVKGGGHTGQAGAVRHGLSRALQHFETAFRPLLKKEKLLTRDPRSVERKKPGQKKARKKFQWVKR